MYSKDGITPEGYQEFNIYATYFVNDNFSIKLSDYYYPSLDNEEETNNKFFNYGEDAVKAIDLNLNFDFSEIWLPFNVSLSTLIAGNDFKYDFLNLFLGLVYKFQIGIATFKPALFAHSYHWSTQQFTDKQKHNKEYANKG